MAKKELWVMLKRHGNKNVTVITFTECLLKFKESRREVVVGSVLEEGRLIDRTPIKSVD